MCKCEWELWITALQYHAFGGLNGTLVFCGESSSVSGCPDWSHLTRTPKKLHRDMAVKVLKYTLKVAFGFRASSHWCDARPRVWLALHCCAGHMWCPCDANFRHTNCIAAECASHSKQTRAGPPPSLFFFLIRDRIWSRVPTHTLHLANCGVLLTWHTLCNQFTWIGLWICTAFSVNRAQRNPYKILLYPLPWYISCPKLLKIMAAEKSTQFYCIFHRSRN